MSRQYLLGAVAFTLYYIVTNFFFGYICPSMIFVGLPCPACGLTRAGLLFFSFNFSESFEMHPLFVPVLVFLVWLIICKIYWPNRLWLILTPAILLFFCFIAVYIYRMALIFPNYPPLMINRDSILHNIITLLEELE